MTKVFPENIEIEVANATKPQVVSNFPYPLNALDDRIFEILTYTIYKKRIADKDKELFPLYDDILLMQGVGEKGMDCVLTKRNKFAAFIQCKKYSKNLTEQQIILELVKFCLHFYLNKENFTYPKKFKYIIATSTGFSGNALQLLEKLTTKSGVKSIRVQKIIELIIPKFKEFRSLNSEKIYLEVETLLLSFTYEYFSPADYNVWINGFPEIVETFFEIKKVTDNSEIKKSTKQIIDTIENQPKIDLTQEVGKFLKQYKPSLVEKLNTINFIGFDLHKYRQRPTDITLTELFVQPSFHQRIDEKNKRVSSIVTKDLKIANIFKSEKNIIILGDPGAGKSLLVKFLIVQILLENSGSVGLRSFAKSVPFRIELRKYNEVRESKSIIEYLADLITRENQTPVSVNLLVEIFKSNNTLVFFDGLDEIFNVSHKTKMKELIESFTSVYPLSKCIVTSRFIGYHDIKFNAKRFDEFAIQQFDENQVKELVTRFYSSQIHNTEKRNKSIEQCLLQIENDVDIELKSNPLIMTLILILSSNNIVIPDSKLEIYEACTKTLVDSLDIKEKELRFEMPVKHKRLAFAHLAYWHYESVTKNLIINYDKAIKCLSTFLLEKGEVSEYVDAEDKSKKFLDYAEKRSIYFEDNFTHKTFLEYYTADYLYINYFTKASDTAKKKVISIITNYLPKSFWYIVFELLLSRVDNEQADDELMDEIFTKQIESGSLNVFYFLISNLAKLNNVSEGVKKTVIIKTFQLCIKGEKVTEIRKGFHFEENSLLAKINKLIENDSTKKILQEVVYHFENTLTSENELIEFYILFYEIGTFHIGKEHPLLINNIIKVENLSTKDLHLYSQSVIGGKKKNIGLKPDILINQMRYFGNDSIFQELKFHHRENATRIDTFNIYLMNIIENSDIETLKIIYSEIVSAGVSHKEILQHVKTNRVYFFHRPENFDKILNLFLKSDDAKLDEIILDTLDKKTVKNLYQNFRNLNKNPKLKITDAVFK